MTPNRNLPNELLEAYLKTAYVISDEAFNFTLRVNEKNSDLDDLLRLYQKEFAAFLTAYNPRSELLNRSENEKRQRELISILEAKGYQFLGGYGQSQTSDWSPEASVLILGMDLQTASKLARRFEQNAFLFIAKGAAPELIFPN